MTTSLIPPPREGGFRAELAAIPVAFIFLTIASGMVDAVTFLALGHVFVANMTGNVVFLGFAAAGDRDISATGSLAALAAFVIGSFAGGALSVRSRSPERLMLRGTAINFVLVLATVIVVITMGSAIESAAGFLVIVLLALAMGIQSAAARTIGVPDFTTTVLTMTITGLAADLARGVSPKTLRRLVSVGAMFVGAAAGAVLVLRAGIPAALGGVCLVFALSIAIELRSLRTAGETKPLVSARILFGTSAMMFAVISLLWRDSVMWQDVRWFGFSAAIAAWGLAVAQVIGGAGILHPRSARLASLILGIVFALFSLASIPDIVRAPTTYVQYGNFFEQFAVVCGALAVYAATESSSARSAALRRAARIGFGFCAISFALAQIVYVRFTATLVPAWLPPNQVFWVNLTTIAFLLAAVAVLIHRQAQRALHLTALMLVLFAVLVWIPHIIAHPAALPNWSEFAETLLIAGSAWVVADVTKSSVGNVSRR